MTCIERSGDAVGTLGSKRLCGFTLIELLAVMAVIVLLLSAVAPAVVSISRGQGVTRTVDEVSSALEHARGQAMARSTWVYVCISNPSAGAASASQLRLAEYASTDGLTGTSTTGGQTTLSATDLQRLLPMVTVNNASATLSGTSTTSLAYTATVSGGSVTFDTIIAYSPQGEAVLDPGKRTVDAWLDLRVAEFRNGAALTTNTADIKLSGTSGQVMLIRH